MSGIDSELPRPVPDSTEPKNPGELVDSGGDLSADQLKAGLQQLGDPDVSTKSLTANELAAKLQRLEQPAVDKITKMSKFKYRSAEENIKLIKPENIFTSANRSIELIRDKVTGSKGEPLPDLVSEAYLAALQAQADAQVASIMAQLAAGEVVDREVALDTGMLFANTRSGSGVEDLDDPKRFTERYLRMISLSRNTSKEEPFKKYLIPKPYEQDIQERQVGDEDPVPSPIDATPPPERLE